MLPLASVAASSSGSVTRRECVAGCVMDGLCVAGVFDGGVAEGV